ncbi:MAG TPA: hypothetical protein IAC04_08515 [Candidatus Coprenecus stercoravium]|uniref:Lipoprotein n=1 Tax=Candidatus Coprenecus stercoravium TaxID=2840735 RepID=A0A9D2GSN8_9BACT|nr:hypothetical protein [Candidatus Coprenecus stercoravium]
MMTKTQLGRYAFLRLAAALPLLTATFLAFGCGNRAQTPPQNITGPDNTCIQTAPDAGTQQDSVTVIDISQDGKVKFNGKECPYLEVRKYLAGEESPESTIRINFNGDSRTGILSDVSNAIDSSRAIEYMIIEGNDKDHKVRIKFAADTASVNLSDKDRTSSAKDSVSSICISIANAGDRTSVTINGREYDYGNDDIGSIISGISGNISTADISIVGDIVMEVLTDVKQSLREAGTQRISITYKTNENTATLKTEEIRILHPAADEKADSSTIASSETAGDGTARHKNVNNTTIVIDDGHDLDPQEITGMFADIIRKTGISTDKHKNNLSILFSPDKNSSYETLQETESCIKEAYRQVRDAYSLEHFGKPLSELTAEELEQVRKAIPIRISVAEQLED